jgi:hypothetical protein
MYSAWYEIIFAAMACSMSKRGILKPMGRGASLSFLSQYPKEEEILIPPRSYLEVVGPSRIETGAHGLQIRSA